MTITFNGSSFTNLLHELPIPKQAERPITRKSFSGLTGEATFVGAFEGRDIVCKALMTGYSAHDLLLSAFLTYQSLRGTNGSLNFDLGGGDSYTFTNCTFESVEMDEKPMLDGSGTNGFYAPITFTWRNSAS